MFFPPMHACHGPAASPSPLFLAHPAYYFKGSLPLPIAPRPIEQAGAPTGPEVEQIYLFEPLTTIVVFRCKGAIALRPLGLALKW